MLRRLLVPLDGSEFAEGALTCARELAEKMGLEIMLVRAVLARAVGPEGAVRMTREQVSAEAGHYLAAIAATIADAGVPARYIVLYGDAAEEIIDAAEQHDVDLIVIASHGRSALDGTTWGGVADRVLRGASRPVLLVPAAAVVARAASGKPGALRRCHNCGRITHKAELSPEDRCLRCGYHLRSCANCAFFDGIMCLMQNPQEREVYAGASCPDFRFREAKPGRNGRPPAPGAPGANREYGWELGSRETRGHGSESSGGL